MSKKSIYPSKAERRATIFGGRYRDTAIASALNITSASLFYYRVSLRAILLLYAVLSIIAAFESLAVLTMGVFDITLTSLSLTHTLIILGSLLAMLAFHNQILMITAHGYKSKDGQLIVDANSSHNDCKGVLGAAKSLSFMSFIMAVITLWLVWGAVGTPLYKGLFSEQWQALMDFMNVVIFHVQNPDEISSDDLQKSGYELLSFIWIVTTGLIAIMLVSAFSWLHTTIAKLRVLKSSIGYENPFPTL